MGDKMIGDDTTGVGSYVAARLLYRDSAIRRRSCVPALSRSLQFVESHTMTDAV